MTAVGLFAACERYRFATELFDPGEEVHEDCTSCAHQYGVRACPIFRQRFLRACLPVDVLTPQEREVPS